jgi:hypothetical protein
MIANTSNPVVRRNAILTTGIVMVVLAILDEPSVLLRFTSPKGLTGLGLIVMGTFCLAQGIASAARNTLKSPIEPWYARPGALLFLLVATLVVLTVWLYTGTTATALVGTPRIDKDVHIYSLIGLIFIWIPLQQWVSYVT